MPHNIPQQQGNTPPSALLSFGEWPTGLYGTPRADGDSINTIVLGTFLHSRVDVTITTQSAEWLDDLIGVLTAVRDRVAGLVTS